MIELVVSGTKDAIVMVEVGAKEVDEKKILEGIEYAHAEIKKIEDVARWLVGIHQ